MKKPAQGGAGGRVAKSRVADSTHITLEHELSTAPARIELNSNLAEHLSLLRALYGRVAFLTPQACASCGETLPAEARHTCGLGFLAAEPIVFFLCGPCLQAGKAGDETVEEKVHDRIDAAATFMDQLSREAEA